MRCEGRFHNGKQLLGVSMRESFVLAILHSCKLGSYVNYK
jgi:hypothetical protein